MNTVSLEAPVSTAENAPTWADVIATRPATTETPFAALDLMRLVAALTPLQQQLCVLLVEEGLTVREAASRLGMGHTKAYEELKRLRELFEARGLRDYLKT